MDIEKVFNKSIDENLLSESGKPPLILIVDDDKDSFDILSASLGVTELGALNVRWASDGLEALKECERQLPDIILLDILMPKMDGFEFIREFRKNPDVAKVSIIFISTIDAVGERIRGLDLGAIDFISKPFNPVEVALRVGRHVELHRLMKEVERQRKAFSEQAAILDTIFNSVPSGLAVLDQQYRILHHNQPFANFFPGFASAFVGQDFFEVLRAEGKAQDDSMEASVKDFLSRTFNKEKIPALSLSFHGDDGLHDSHHLSMLATPFPHREDCLLLDLRNITDLIEAERRVALLDRLAMLGQISVGVAHEINNPNGFVRLKAHNLKTIYNALDPILDVGLEHGAGAQVGRLSVDEMRKRQNEAVEGILKATERITAVVERLKSFGRDSTLTAEEVDMKVVVKNAVEISEHHLQSIEEVRIDVPDAPLPAAKGNQIEFEQILVNLLTNAVQAIEERRESEGNGYEGNVSIRIVPGAGEIGIFVSDNGKGIQDNLKSKIFMPYFTTKERGKGTGLGLSISHELISKYGGRIEVEGEPMKGATLKLFVPIHAAGGTERPRD